MIKGWDKIRLDEFVKFQRGFDLPKDNFVQGTVPVYGSTSILGFHNIVKVKAPGVITGRSGTLGQFQYANDDFWPHNTSLWVKDFKGNNPKFAYYLMQCLDFADFNSGGAVPTLNRNVLRSFKVDVPPLPIQRRIAKILSSYDDLIENNLQRIKLLEELAQNTYEDWFAYRKIDDGIIKDSEIDFVQLEELIQNYMNGGWGKDVEEGSYLIPAYVIRGTDMPDIANGYFDRLPLRFHTKGNFSERQLINGDIIIEMSNGNIDNVGRSFYINDIFIDQINQPAICASFCKMLRPKNLELSFIIDSHIKYIYSTNRMSVYKSQAANGINNFRFEDMISDEQLMIPKGQLLSSLVNNLKPKYELISNLRSQIKLLKEARDILLPRLMTGMIDVENLEMEI